MQGRFKRDSGAAGEPEQQPGGTGNGSAQGAGDSGAATPGTTAATGRSSTPSGIEAGKITGLDGKTGPRIAMRNWRISTRLVSLLALPVVTASALGGLRINSSLDNIHQLEQMKTLTDITENATDLAAALQEERDSSAGPLASHRTNDDAVAASRAATDRQVNLFEKSTDENISADDPVFNGVRTTLLSIDSQLHTLTDIRGRAYTGDVGISQTVTQYDSLIQSLLALSQDMAQATSNHEMIQATRALAAFSSAKEYESMQRAVISAAFATGKLLPDDYQTVNSAYTQEATALTRFTSVYGPLAAQELLAPTRDNDTIQAHDAELERIAKSPNGFTKFDSSYRDWDDAAKTKIQAMRQIELAPDRHAAEVPQAAERGQAGSADLRRDHPAGPRRRRGRRLHRRPLHDPFAAPAPADGAGSRPEAAARAGPPALRDRPAGRGHLGRVDRHQQP